MQISHWIKPFLRISFFAGLAQIAAPAFAHPGHGQGGVLTGMAHPFLGLDHVAAMVAVGLIAARLGGAVRWILPASFVATMAVGIVLGVGSSAPIVELGVGLSVVLLGTWLMKSGSALPASSAIAIAATAGLLHGWAHGADGVAQSSGAGYIAGVLCATAVLHLGGLGVGVLLQRPGRLRENGWLVAGASVAGAGLLSLGF